MPYGTEIQHYLYPSPYYAHQDLGNRLYAPTQVGNSQSKGNNGPLSSNSENMSSNSNTYYRHGGIHSPISGVDASAFSGAHFNREAGFGFTSLMTPTDNPHPVASPTVQIHGSCLTVTNTFISSFFAYFYMWVTIPAESL